MKFNSYSHNRVPPVSNAVVRPRAKGELAYICHRVMSTTQIDISLAADDRLGAELAQ